MNKTPKIIILLKSKNSIKNFTIKNVLTKNLEIYKTFKILLVLRFQLKI